MRVHRACVRTCVRVCVCVCVYMPLWKQHLTTETLAERFGLAADTRELLREYQLRWLGDLGHGDRMGSSRARKSVLFCGATVGTQYSPDRAQRSAGEM